MNIIIVGQGAMGLLWYHHLKKSMKADSQKKLSSLYLLPSPKEASQQETLKEQVYSFTDINGVKHISDIQFAQIKHIQTADVIILCLKSFHTISALKNISPLLKSNVSILLAHNGMGTFEQLPEHIKQNSNIYAMLTTHGCFRKAPFTIMHTGLGITDLGLLSGDINNEQRHTITQLLNVALPSVVYHENIKHKQWLKLAVNCVINPLTAINNIDNGEINNAEYCQPIERLVTEFCDVANAEGVLLNADMLKEIVKTVASATANNKSSMRCDILENRQTEIDYINGYIHNLGTIHNIATPENTKMWQTVKSLQKRTININGC